MKQLLCVVKYKGNRLTSVKGQLSRPPSHIGEKDPSGGKFSGISNKEIDTSIAVRKEEDKNV